ncbi:Two component system response regulator/histidine kinase, HAMP domain-containing [Desulfonema limicola]|uniref:histidine kinase n=1 Tax=Desulfonema limicola TaxID=45656 RepID=A0A975BD30_9BACT|nr:ATP-binding protein [Desulfonema limicola]QTA83045.1 Two component system response regulator/histidine kinase, HAMP domain-containing [Desulfonema limicola]
MKKRFMIYLFIVIASSVCITAFISGGYGHIKIKNILENQKDDLYVNIKNYLITFDKMLFIIEKQMVDYTKKATLAITEVVTENGELKNNYTPNQLKEIAVSHGVTDISFINSQGIVINSSVEQDININLFGFSPRFRKYIESIYGKGEVKGHRITLSVSTKELTMFSYYSPAGSNYIVETWTNVKDYILLEYSRQYFDFLFNNFFLRLKQENRYLKDIGLFIGTIKPISAVSLINGKTLEAQEVEMTIGNHEFEISKNLKIVNGDQYIFYHFFNLENNPNFGFTNNILVKIEYDFNLLSTFRRNIILCSFLSGILIISGMFIISSYIFNIYIIQRIKSINKGLEYIANGMYNNEIIIQGNDDIARIAENIAAMKEKIIARETSLLENEKKLRQHQNELEQKVKERTFELAEINKELQYKKQQAESANLAKSEFLANMSHEIRTPLNSVLGFSEILQGMTTDTRQKNFLQKIHVSGKALLSLINDILDLSKIEAGRLEICQEKIDIKNIFFDISEIFTEKFQEKGIEFKINISQGMPLCIFMDEARIRQILINLVGNALKFTEKGQVELRAGIEFESYENFEKRNFIIEIEDTGIGIPQDQKKMIFESFVQQQGQNNKKYGGTGLGLTITEKLVRMMNGRIIVKSEPEKGSIFKIVFHDIKVCEDNNLIKSTSEKDDKQIRFKKPLILIVDDTAYNREMIKELLLSLSCYIIEAETGEQALDILKNKKNIDLILTDIRMPGMDGYKLNKKIKTNKDLQDIPVIAVTASALKTDQEKLKIFFSGYLTKPIDRANLISELKRFLPFEIIKSEEQINNNKDCPGNKFTCSPELFEIIENKLIPFWADIKETFFIDDVVDFALLLIKTADQYGISLLKTYAENLHESCESYEIDKIESLIQDFPEICKQIKEKFSFSKI